jgi:hypothetical protein
MPTPGRPRNHPDGEARQYARDEADRLMSDPPAALAAWADRQGVSLVSRDSGVWAATERRLQRDGLLTIARIWRLEQTRELVNMGVCRRKMVAKEICMRVICERIYASRNVILFRPHEGDDGDLDCLPKDLRWIYCHPLLCAGDSKDPVMAALAVNYEREHKAPHQGAINRFMACVDDPKSRDTLFKEIKEILLADRKKAPLPVDAHVGGSELTADEQAVMDLDAELVNEGGEA